MNVNLVKLAGLILPLQSTPKQNCSNGWRLINLHRNEMHFIPVDIQITTRRKCIEIKVKKNYRFALNCEDWRFEWSADLSTGVKGKDDRIESLHHLEPSSMWIDQEKALLSWEIVVITFEEKTLIEWYWFITFVFLPLICQTNLISSG